MSQIFKEASKKSRRGSSRRQSVDPGLILKSFPIIV